MSTFIFISLTKAPLVKPSTIVFLPLRDLILQNTLTDPNLYIGAFNHTIVIISCLEPKLMKIDSKFKIAIISPP